MTNSSWQFTASGGPQMTTGPYGETWIEQPLPAPWEKWIVASRVLPDDRGVPVIAEVRIFPHEKHRRPDRPGQWAIDTRDLAAAREALPRGGMPATALRRGVPLSAHATLAGRFLLSLAQLGRATDEKGTQLFPGQRRAADQLASEGFDLRTPQPAAPRSNRGRPLRWTAADLARVALMFDDAIRAGQSPTPAIAAALRESTAVARNLIKKARALGKLRKAAGRGIRDRATLSDHDRRRLAMEARTSTIGKRRR